MELFHASYQWASRPKDERYETVAQLAEAVKGRRLRSLAFDSVLDRVSFEVEKGEWRDQIVVRESGSAMSLVPTHWSFGQLSAWVGAPASYLRELSPQLAVDCLRYSADHSDRHKDLKIMAIADDDGGSPTLQAVTSTKYGRIWDADVVEAVQRVVEKSEGKFHNPPDWTGKPSGLYASDRDVFAFMIDGGSIVEAGRTLDGKDDVLHRGFYVWNSEVGARTFGLATFLFRVVCGNHIIWGAEDVRVLKVRHTLYAPEKFASEMYPALASTMNRTAKPEEEMIRKAQQYLLPRDTKELQEFGLGHALTKGEVKLGYDTAVKEEGDCRTLWQFVNGLTAAARMVAYADARVDLENRAARMLKLAA